MADGRPLAALPCGLLSLISADRPRQTAGPHTISPLWGVAGLAGTRVLGPPVAAGALRAAFVTKHPVAAVGIGLGWAVLVMAGAIATGLFNKFRDDAVSFLYRMFRREEPRFESGPTWNLFA
jgi:hypothetical protein